MKVPPSAIFLPDNVLTCFFDLFPAFSSIRLLAVANLTSPEEPRIISSKQETIGSRDGGTPKKDRPFFCSKLFLPFGLEIFQKSCEKKMVNLTTTEFFFYKCKKMQIIFSPESFVSRGGWVPSNFSDSC